MKRFTFLLITFLFVTLSSFQLISTQLKIQVLNNLGKAEWGVKVKIFKTEEDYNTEKNAIEEQFTDKKGYVNFKNLETIPYYILAVKDTKSNAANGVKSDPLKEKTINKMTVVISE